MSLFVLEGSHFNGEFFNNLPAKENHRKPNKRPMDQPGQCLQKCSFQSSGMGWERRVSEKNQKIQYSVVNHSSCLWGWKKNMTNELLMNDKIMKTLLLFTTTNFSSFMCKIISEYVFSLSYQIIPKKENVILAIPKQTKYL